MGYFLVEVPLKSVALELMLLKHLAWARRQWFPQSLAEQAALVRKASQQPALQQALLLRPMAYLRLSPLGLPLGRHL